jgi:hypothetical protein
MTRRTPKLFPPNARVAGAAPAPQFSAPPPPVDIDRAKRKALGLSHPFAAWTRAPAKGVMIHAADRLGAEDTIVLNRDAAKRRDQIATFLAAAPAEVRDAAVSRSEDGMGDVMARFVYSDESVDSYNSTLRADGYELSDFKRNPVILFVHNSRGFPVGQDQGVYVDQARRALIGTPRFLSAELDPFAAKVGRFVAARILRAVSVGFEPLEWRVNETRDDGQGIFVPVDFTRQLLREVSVCPVPANRNALLDEKRLGEVGLGLDDVATLVEDMLDGTGHAFLPRADLEALRAATRGTKVMIDMSDVGLGCFELVRAPAPGEEPAAENPAEPATAEGEPVVEEPSAEEEMLARCPACGYESGSSEFQPMAPEEPAPGQASAAPLDRASVASDPAVQAQLRTLVNGLADEIQAAEHQDDGRLP